MLPNPKIEPLFKATVEATEEAILNALTAAETMTGINSTTVHQLPHDRVRGLMEKYGR
ncbi:MAG: P1 family peptidase [Pseudomonadales bacterium]|nr:P1 family peptidase [Pseudomonadales bacterium]